MPAILSYIARRQKTERFIKVIWITIFVIFCNQSFGQGLKFVAGDQAIEKRTSLKIYPSKSFESYKYFEISFEINISKNSAVGYIFRIKEKEDSPIFNLYFDEENNKAIFRLNEEGKFSLIKTEISSEKLSIGSWIPIKIKFDLENKEVILQISNQRPQVAKANLSIPSTPTIYFGKSDYMIDVPSMSIRNLKLGNSENETYIPFKESEGSLLHNLKGDIIGEVNNGIWLSNNSYHWQKRLITSFSSESGSEYNSKTKSIYYFNRDSLQIFNLLTSELKKIKFSSPCPVQIHRGNTFIDTSNNKLYVYETYFPSTYNGPSMASLDLENNQWKIESVDNLNKELNHHGYVFLNDSHQLLIFGGFGNMAYSNKFSEYTIGTDRWKQNISTSGPQIFPRYFTSMGYSKIFDKVFIFGGMGNESGEHIVGRRYFYDLYSFNPSTNKVDKLWEIDWKDKPFVPARGLVIQDSNSLFVLGYPEHLTHSLIKLYKFSLKDGQFEQLGDSIPIYSDKISTRAKLYYDNQLKKLICLVQESDDDIRSKIIINTLNFPAISFKELHSFPVVNKPNGVLQYVIACIFIILIFAYLLYRILRRKRTKQPLEIDAYPINPLKSQTRNCIYLFGDFTLIDRKGKDISYLLSTRLQQVFCLILFHSKEVGISSKLLSHLLWPDKPKDKVKTSRGVAINNLRKVLQEIDGIEIVFEDGHFRMIINSECFCDYLEINKEVNNNEGQISDDFYNIIRRGKFLLGHDDPILDEEKSKTEKIIIEILEKDLNQQIQKRNYSQISFVAETILIIDPINENALEKSLFALYMLKSESKAKVIFDKFTEQFELNMGEKYGFSFNHFWKES